VFVQAAVQVMRRHDDSVIPKVGFEHAAAVFGNRQRFNQQNESRELQYLDLSDSSKYRSQGADLAGHPKI
jgi:hypothetical protein